MSGLTAERINDLRHWFDTYGNRQERIFAFQLCDEVERLQAENAKLLGDLNEANNKAELFRLAATKPEPIPQIFTATFYPSDHDSAELAAYREIGEVGKVKAVVDAAKAFQVTLYETPRSEWGESESVFDGYGRLAACLHDLGFRSKPSPQPVALSEEDSETLRYLLNERKPITPEMSAKVQQLYHHLGLEW